MSERLLDRHVFITGFGFPVVPRGEARLRCQISAAHTRADLDEAIASLTAVGRELKVI
jgi:glycine C-acetyltransferase